VKIYFIGAGPGDPRLITLRGLQLIKRSPIIIYAGSLVNPKLLDYCPPQVTAYDSSRMNLEQICRVFGQAHADDKDVARLHSGDPCLYGALGEQLDWLAQRGIPYEIIPGVSSFCAAAASLGRELTAPELTQSVILTRASGRTPVPFREDLSQLAVHRASMVIFLSVDQIERVVEQLKAGYPESTPVAVISRASWDDEQIIRGDLADIAPKVKQAGITKTALIVVGQVLGHKYKPSRLYAKDFSHQYRQAE
jgi:precorrin-4/cobalt-precorrin-4 C11-methyltransferase